MELKGQTATDAATILDLDLFFKQFSLCNLCVLCVSVVSFDQVSLTTETQRTQRLHRDVATVLISKPCRPYQFSTV